MPAIGTFIATGRDRALLRAVAAGRCQLGCGCEPLLLVDGLVCADTAAGYRLVAAGMLVPPDPALPFAPAALTPLGAALLAESLATAM